MVRQESDLVAPRDEAFYREYKKALGSDTSVTHYQAIEMALKSQQPRMWVSFYGVYRMLLRIVHHSREAPKNEARHTLEDEITRKYNHLRSMRSFKSASLPFIASFIINEPAIGFYISEAHARRIVRRMRKKHQQEWLKNHSKSTIQWPFCSSCAR